MRQYPSPKKLEKLPSDASRQRRLSKVSFSIYNGESYTDKILIAAGGLKTQWKCAHQVMKQMSLF